MFPLGVRLSTWLAATAFLALAGWRRDRAPLLAGWAWLTGFEAIFQATALTLGHPLPVGRDGPIFYVTLGLITVPWLAWHGVLPSPRLMAAVAILWAVWVAAGFPVNPHQAAAVDPAAEILNEVTKTLWAAAYLWPLRSLRGASRSRSRIGSRSP